MSAPRPFRTASAIAVIAVTACQWRPAAGEERVPGTIDFYQDGTRGVLMAPDTVEAGTAFPVTITTYGGGCERAGGAEVRFAGDTATVTVYDYTRAGPPPQACPDILRYMPRSVTLRFDRPGEAVLRVRGRRIGPEAPDGIPRLLEHRIVIR